MDKKKQIQEMIDIQRKNCLGKGVGDCVDADCNACSALAIYNAGYRKIPEIPKETVLTADDIAELLTIVARDTRKETAEKFAERLLEEAFADFSDDDYDRLCILVDEIAKKIMEGKV